jgi:hypothetical protein
MEMQDCNMSAFGYLIAKVEDLCGRKNTVACDLLMQSIKKHGNDMPYELYNATRSWIGRPDCKYIDQYRIIKLVKSYTKDELEEHIISMTVQGWDAMEKTKSAQIQQQQSTGQLGQMAQMAQYKQMAQSLSNQAHNFGWEDPRNLNHTAAAMVAQANARKDNY